MNLRRIQLLFPFLVCIIALPSCSWRKKAVTEGAPQETINTINLPLNSYADTDEETVDSFFETDGDEFDALAQPNVQNSIENNQKQIAWLEQTPATDNKFDKVYFDFDDRVIRKDQKPVVQKDATIAAQSVKESNTIIVAEGHACHSAGSRAYNLAISRDRAQEVAKELIAAGVKKDHIKVVGRGDEMPAIMNGKTVEGNKEQQWPNRRVELHVIS